MLLGIIDFAYWYAGKDKEECASNFLFTVYAAHV